MNQKGFANKILVLGIGTVLVLTLGIAITTKSVGTVAPSDYGLNEGNTISAADYGDPDIYIVNTYGYKRLFLSPKIFKLYDQLGGFAKVKHVTPQIRDTFVTSGLFRNCETNGPKVYAVEVTGKYISDTGIFHWVNIDGDQAVSQDPNFFKKVFCINNSEFSFYQQGNAYTSLNQIPIYVGILTSGISASGTVPYFLLDDNGTRDVPNNIFEDKVAQKFYQSNPDNYDFLIILTATPKNYEAMNNFNNITIKNDIQGIGMAKFDNAAQYGSKGRLRSVIWMNSLAEAFPVQGVKNVSPQTPNVVGNGSYITLFHEIQHAWGVYIGCAKDQNCALPVQNPLNFGHWDLLTSAPYPYTISQAGQIIDNGDGTFTRPCSTNAIADYFYPLHPLDLYLNGMFSPVEVPNTYFVVTPNDPNATNCPVSGPVTFKGTKFSFSVQDIIKAHGPRVPNSVNSQKDFNIAFVIAQNQQYPATGPLLDVLNEFLKRVPDMWSWWTQGKSTLHIASFPGILPAASLTVSQNPNFSSPTYQAGSVGTRIASFNLTASQGQNINISSIVLNTAYNINQSLFQNLKIRDNNGVLWGTVYAVVSPATGFTFTGASPIQVPAGGFVTINVNADILSSAPPATYISPISFSGIVDSPATNFASSVAGQNVTITSATPAASLTVSQNPNLFYGLGRWNF